MIYSTLKEVYNVDTFEKKKKKRCVDDYSENGDEGMSKDRKTKDLYVQSVPTQCATPPSRKYPMNNVKPFLDDELEHYFNFNEYQNTATKSQPDTSNSAPAMPATVATPVMPPAVTSSATTPVAAIAPSTSKQSLTKDAYYKNLINIGLFVFIGILIIFLCDQITEIAVNIGMKKTVYILEPYLARLEKLQERS